MDQSRSDLFEGFVGSFVSGSDFPLLNVLFSPCKYDYEGNWAFCRFDHDDVLGARIGFGRGAMDFRDYGAAEPPSRDLLFVHIEVLTSDAAHLWTDRFSWSAGDVEFSDGENRMRLVKDQAPIFEIDGWPRMSWTFREPHGRLSASLTLEAENAVVLPDQLLPNNRFAMWWSPTVVTGTVQVDGRMYQVDGRAYCDHPRVMLARNDASPFGWMLYQPMLLGDGSVLCCFFTADQQLRRIDDYSFAYMRAPDGEVTHYSDVRIDHIAVDRDQKLEAWQVSLTSKHSRVAISASAVGPRRVIAWGNPGTGATRAEIGNIPLPFDCSLQIQRDSTAVSKVSGWGIGEVTVHSSISPTDVAF